MNIENRKGQLSWRSVVINGWHHTADVFVNANTYMGISAYIRVVTAIQEAMIISHGRPNYPSELFLLS